MLARWKPRPFKAETRKAFRWSALLLAKSLFLGILLEREGSRIVLICVAAGGRYLSWQLALLAA
jgi:hypothetical protein